MFVRVTRTEGDPAKLEQAIATYQQQVIPRARQMAGFAGAVLLADRSTGAGLSVTYWQSEEALRESEPAADTLRAQVAQTTGARVQEVERFEIVLQERTAPPQAHTFVRVNTVYGSPDRIDESVRFVREQVTPVLKQQRGFRAVLMGVNRQSGRAVVSTVWDSAADREASDAALSELRRRGGQMAGTDRVQVELFETVFAEVSQAAAASAV